MKNKNILVVLFGLFVFIGCKNNNSNDGGKSEAQKTIKPFTVTLRVVVKKDDDFCVLYTEDGTINFGSNGIWKSVKGSENEQLIPFELPSDVIPTELRLDFGIKPEQTDVILKSVILEYKDKRREITGSELALFFRADENTCKFDANTGIVKANLKNGVRQNPSLYPGELIVKQEIEKLVR